MNVCRMSQFVAANFWYSQDQLKLIEVYKSRMLRESFVKTPIFKKHTRIKDELFSNNPRRKPLVYCPTASNNYQLRQIGT